MCIRDRHWIAVGSGTGDALARAGIDGVVTPIRMDSEGLLALPCLQAVSYTHLDVYKRQNSPQRTALA